MTIEPTMTFPSSNEASASTTDTAAAVADLTAAETNAPGHKACLSYVYVGRGLTVKTVTDSTVIAYEPLTNHNGDGTNVLFGDGHVEFMNKQEWTKLAAGKGVAVVAPPAVQR